MNIDFEKANLNHKDVIFHWLKEPHVQEFWDNSHAHREDILNFMEGRIEPSGYCNGLYTYWIGLIDGEPYCLVMTLQEKQEYDLPAPPKTYLSKYGHTYRINYMIGNTAYWDKGLDAKTLEMFIDFLRNNYDDLADTFLIDPDANNSRHKHVYEKAGFQYIDDFNMEGEGEFLGQKTHFLVKQFPTKMQVIPTTPMDYPMLQNMAQFYIDDIFNQCSSISKNWKISKKIFSDQFNFKIYFQEPGRKAYFIKVANELAGFALLNQFGMDEKDNWNIGEFFILNQFQSHGFGLRAAHHIWDKHPGKWEVAVRPQNEAARGFWRKAIGSYMSGDYHEEIEKVTYVQEASYLVVFSFDNTANKK